MNKPWNTSDDKNQILLPAVSYPLRVASSNYNTITRLDQKRFTRAIIHEALTGLNCVSLLHTFETMQFSRDAGFYPTPGNR